ncbi:MAG: cytochrome c3 family protein [Gammaproteobacteria bacterium]
MIILTAVVVGCVSQPADKAPPAATSVPASDGQGGQNTQSAGTAGNNTPVQTDAKTMVAENAGTGGRKAEAPQQAQTPPQPSSSDYYSLNGQMVGGKKLSIPKITGSVPPRDDDYHDTDNNAIVVLQSPTEAMADFPRDRRNEVDWVKTLDQGLIEPRADLKGEGEMVTLDMDILMKNTQFMPWVKFPHIVHTRWLACENCHPKIFIPQEGANPISMNKVLRGEYCGVCHDKVAFSLFVCERCHSVPHQGSGPAWWK